MAGHFIVNIIKATKVHNRLWGYYRAIIRLNGGVILLTRQGLCQPALHLWSTAAVTY